MKKTYLKIISFLLVFVLLIVSLSFTIFSEANIGNIDPGLISNYSYASEKKNSIQILCLGNSDISAGIDTNRIWEECGYTTTTVSGAFLTPQKAYDKLNKVLKNQSLELLILETDMLYKATAAKSGTGLQAKLNVFFGYIDPVVFDGEVEEAFTLFQFHDTWKKLFYKDDTVNIAQYTHGYRYSSNIQGVSFKGFMIPSNEREEIEQINIDYTKKIIDTCKENKIKVVMLEIVSPYSWNYARHNATKDLADSLGIDFIDTNVLLDEIGFNVDKDFRDTGNHLNYTGATKMTKYLCSYINKHYKFEDRRGNPDYQYWQDSYDEFKKLAKIS